MAIGWLIDRESELDVCTDPPAGFVCNNPGAIQDQRDASIVTLFLTTATAITLACVGLFLWLTADPDDDPDTAMRCTTLGCAGRF